MWPYKNVSRKEFEDRKDFVDKILRQSGCKILDIKLPYEQKSSAYGPDFEETWISKRPLYQYKNCYYRIDEVLFREKPFIVLECANTLEEVMDNMMEDGDPFPYDLSDIKTRNEVRNSLGMEPLSFQYAEEEDVPTILYFIKELAAYEQMLNEVAATEELLKEWILEQKKAEVIFAVEDGREIGFALFFHNFSTFLGRAGIYLEDLYVMPEYRGRGYGKALLQRLAQIAIERGCGRLEWWCLDWNKPSIDFYLSLGAEPMKDWTVYRIAGDTLRKLGE